jgi:Spy/CpxP family protein refolding chaperone
MRRALIIAFAFTVLAVALPSAAQAPPGPDGPCRPGAAQHQIAVYLGLTDEQVAAWDVLIDDGQAAAAPVRDAIAAVQQELDELLAGNDPDPMAVGGLVIQRRDLGQQLADIERGYVEGVEGLLDEQQVARYRFIRRAERAEPLFPAFRLLRLLPPHWQ